MLKMLPLSLSRQYTVDGQYIPSLFIEPEVRHDKTSYLPARFIVARHSIHCPRDTVAIKSFLARCIFNVRFVKKL